METPSFLLWAIEFGCPVRSFEDGAIPERAERQLRAARAFSEARREGRIFEGLALAPPNGFRVDEALAIYGGADAVEAACRGCPANAMAAADPAALAGCYGYVPLPADPTPVYEAVERAIDAEYQSEWWDGSFPVTRPRWFSMFMEPLWAEYLFVAYRVLEIAAVSDKACRQGLDDLMLGLNAAFNAGRSLHARLFPAGRVEGVNWKMVPHCPRCKATWQSERPGTCGVCGYVGHPAPDKKRLARGERPYFPLDRLLGAEQAEQLLVRYAARQAQPATPGPA